jgi:ketol-acid reductoisomerase
MSNELKDFVSALIKVSEIEYFMVKDKFDTREELSQYFFERYMQIGDDETIKKFESREAMETIFKHLSEKIANKHYNVSTSTTTKRKFDNNNQQQQDSKKMKHTPVLTEVVDYPKWVQEISKEEIGDDENFTLTWGEYSTVCSRNVQSHNDKVSSFLVKNPREMTFISWCHNKSVNDPTLSWTT